ncbi:MAG: hypothetical protein ABI353_22050 [Isosphaeraceae bacterium]
MERRQLVESLSRLPVEELAAVLREVFDGSLPWPKEQSFCRNRFFLGVASSDLESDEDQAERWGRWKLEAVASPDPTHYGTQTGPDWGLCQSGECGVCGVGARSNVKHGLCAVCGADVSMT